MIRKKFIAESRDRASLYANTCTIGTSRPRPFSDERMLFATCHVVTYKMFVNLVTTRGKSAWAGIGGTEYRLMPSAVCCINYRLLPAVFLGYTVVLRRVGLEKKLLKIPL